MNLHTNSQTEFSNHYAPPDACDTLILGRSVAIQRVRELIRQVATWSLPVLIEGPSGAGKELVAKAIHAHSQRTGPLTSVNVSAIPESLFESTILGHRKGAFTGAHNDSDGYVIEAHRGTLFLDEVSTLIPVMQAKLLRVLETGVVRPVGGKADRKSDFRLVTASNEYVPALVANGRMRIDFYHRIRGAVIVLPPLAQRFEDLEILVTRFVRDAAEQANQATVRIAANALRVLSAHDWPGNVRELRQVMQLALALAGGREIGASLVHDAIGQNALERQAQDVAGRSAEVAFLTDLLTRHDWVVASAARELRVTPKTVYCRLKKAGMSLPRRRRS